ncbi:MAG: hypothetical protein AVDCRST_MAG68-4540 [uncultured Gemmatimonadetes bacterium]|uniref:Uncharacterized protein n=1 Tax=uncultured Gemmatimonadota bacterium TaxID=203437 RepID=A0A6J4MNE1_9BACT|nr:MAG: hypothetical protein AVDCRST_MAG68-4540 [uncultured Gemmatimonadota bacterium]
MQTSMKRIVITPTFRPHFPFNREFLQSYGQNAADAHEVAVHFVVSRGELAELRALLEEFPALDVHAHAVEDLLQAAGYEAEAIELLREVGKFAFQALKKLYALKVLPYDQALVLDSESLVLKPTRMGEVFDEYFADPTILYSELGHRAEGWFGSLSDLVTQNAAKLLDEPYPDMYLLEYYGWFYDKRIVEDMFAAIPQELLPAVRGRLGRDKHLFECILYYYFIYTNRSRYGYRFVSVNELLREYLGAEGYEEYIRNFKGHWEAVGIFEYVSKEVSERNLPDILRLFREKNLRFYRSEILNRNERAQDALIEQSPITFLVSSENYRQIRERVAVCISGLPRQYRQNLKLIRNFLADTQADVFFHFWESPDQDFIVRSLEPKAHQFEKPFDPADGPLALDPARVKRREKFTSSQRDGNSFAMFYGIWKANELKRAYEEKQGFRYDVVVRLRLDFFSISTLGDVIARIRAQQAGLEGTLYVPDMAHSVGINDQFAVGSSQTMDTYSAAYRELAAFVEEDYFNPEYFLLRHLLGTGLKIRTFLFEYLLLRDEKVDTFALEEHARRTRTTWWSAQLPKIPAGLLNEYFSAKADSVFWIAELGLETPKVFRLGTAHGYLVVDPGNRKLSFTSAPEEASTFFLIVAGDEDRTAVNIRCRDLALANPSTPGTGVTGWNLYPDARGALHPDGAADAHSAFYMGREGEGHTLEWRPGFWKSPADSRKGDDRPAEFSSEKVEVPTAQRLFLSAGATGVTLQPKGAAAAVLRIEYVHDRAAEASSLGIRAHPGGGPASPSDPLLVRLLWRSYMAARVLDQNGMSELWAQTARFIRRQSRLARRSYRAPRGSDRAGGSERP